MTPTSDDPARIIDGEVAATPVGARVWAIVRGLRPAQWLKNGVIFAGLVFGGKLLDPSAVWRAAVAAFLFCLLSGGFYLINDVRDSRADRAHPLKRARPVAAGEISPALAAWTGVVCIAAANAGSLSLGDGFVLACAAYTGLMVVYNAGIKDIVILDVLTIAIGFVIRAAAGAFAVGVSISPWLLTCTLLLALFIAFGKRRHELVSFGPAAIHRRNLDTYTQPMLDQTVAISAAGTLIAYAVYTFEAESGPSDHRMMVTIPIVAYGIFRYLYLLYRQGEGGAPESMLLTDRGMMAAVALWSLVSATLFYVSP